MPRGVSGFSFYAWIETDTNVVNLPAQNASLLTTVAGNGVPGGLDGPGKMARLNDPRGVAAVPAVLADRYRTASGAAVRAVFTDGHRVRMVDTKGNVETLVGSGAAGFADGVGGSAAFHDPDGIAICPDGSLAVADSGNHRIRRVRPNGLVVTIAGSTAGSADGAGNVATFNGPAGVAVTPGGVIFVADTANHTIRRIMLVAGSDPRQASAYRVVTVAGLAGSSGLADGVGTVARFASPRQVAVCPDGDLYVADTDNARGRRLTDVSGTAMYVSTLAAAVNAPTGLALDAAGNLYVAESSPPLISRISAVGARDALMGSAGTGFVDGPHGQMQSPWNLSLEASGTLLLTDRTNHALRSLQRVLDTAQGHLGAGGGER